MSDPQGRRQVLIIGGGIAGLAAAEALTEIHPDRFQVTVYEAKRNTGGRAGSFVDTVQGVPVDYCQHVAMGCCTNLLGLLARCGLSDRLHRYSSLIFLHPSQPASRFAPSQWLPAPLHLAPALAGLRFLDRAQQRQIQLGLWRLMRTRTSSLIAQTAEQWLRQNGQSDVVRQRFWEVILVSALGEKIDVVSMAAARKVIIDGFASVRGASDVLVPRQPLSMIFGQLLPNSLTRRGVTIRSATAVRRVVADHERLVGIENVEGQLRPADHVISAVPWHQLTRLLAGTQILAQHPPLRAAANFPSSPITGIHLWFDREITSLPQVVLVDTLAQWLFRDDARGEGLPDGAAETPRKSGVGTATYYYQIVISGAHPVCRQGRDAVLAQVLTELAQAFPPARQAQLVRSRFVTDPQAVFSLSPAVDAMRPAATTCLPWFHLAGDWIQTGWPATMEGAVISGRMAAASVCRHEGAELPTIDPGQPRGWLARQLIR